MLPFGPRLKAVCVVPTDSESSCLFARMEGQDGIMAAGAILNEIKQLVLLLLCFFFFFNNCAVFYMAILISK